MKRYKAVKKVEEVEVASLLIEKGITLDERVLSEWILTVTHGNLKMISENGNMIFKPFKVGSKPYHVVLGEYSDGSICFHIYEKIESMGITLI